MSRAQDNNGPIEAGLQAETGRLTATISSNQPLFLGRINLPQRGSLALSSALASVSGALQNAVGQELGSRDAFAWFPVLAALGVLIYYALPVEPSLLAFLMLSLAVALLAVALRNKHGSLLLATGLLALIGGITLAAWQTHRVDTTLLKAAGTYQLLGTVSRVQRGEKRTRVDLQSIELLDASHQQSLGALQLSGYNKHIIDIRIGDRVMVRARLEPFSGPIIPGGYDFRRAGYFKGFSARGYILGSIYPDFDPLAAAKPMSFALQLSTLRQNIADRIVQIIPGQSGALAAALLVGDRSRINDATKEALRGAGLAHILAISGLHMALVTSLIFGFIRLVFAFSPYLVSRYNAKKIAAVFALVSALAYLGLSGSAVSAQRAFVMAAIFLIAILCDRPAITQRNLSIAACLIIFLNPNAVLSPGFQMSFMASVGLVAVFRKGGLVQTFGASNHSLPRKAFAGLASIALTSIVAGAATAPFAIYHFYQTAAFGLLGNLVAMPVVALLIMPAGVVAMLLLPLGLAAAPLLIMEYGLSLVVSVSGWVSSLDGAMLRVGMQSGMVITLLALSILLLCLLRTRLKYVLASAAVTIAIVLSSANTQQPIILIAPNAQMVAINEDGELKILARGKNKFVSRIWLGALADRRELTQVFETSKAASTCTKAACISELNRGQNPPITIIQIKRVEFFEEACRNAESVILISKRDLPEQCPDTTQNPLIIDRSSLQNTGSIAFFPLETNTEPFENDLAKHAATYGFQIQTAHPKIKRPWN